MTPDEIRFWDAAALVALQLIQQPIMVTSDSALAARIADAMLEERRKRIEDPA